jgi:RNA polymerase sigma factor (TIGR02999 family)
MPLVYEELRRLAGRQIRRERPGHTLQPTALIHEAYLRLVGKDRPQWKSRLHFFAVAAQVMRRVLIDHARTRGYAKRGGGWTRLPLAELALPVEEKVVEAVQIVDALEALGTHDGRLKTLVELRYFGGLSNAEAAEVFGVSLSTVKRDWRLARAFLYGELHGGEDEGENHEA